MTNLTIGAWRLSGGLLARVFGGRVVGGRVADRGQRAGGGAVDRDGIGAEVQHLDSPPSLHGPCAPSSRVSREGRQQPSVPQPLLQRRQRRRHPLPAGAAHFLRNEVRRPGVEKNLALVAYPADAEADDEIDSLDPIGLGAETIAALEPGDDPAADGATPRGRFAPAPGRLLAVRAARASLRPMPLLDDGRPRG